MRRNMESSQVCSISPVFVKLEALMSFLRLLFFFFLMIRRPPRSTLFPYTTSSDLVAQGRERDSGAVTTLADGRKALHVDVGPRSEEHTSELQSRGHLVCRLLLE